MEVEMVMVDMDFLVKIFLHVSIVVNQVIIQTIVGSSMESHSWE